MWREAHSGSGEAGAEHWPIRGQYCEAVTNQKPAPSSGWAGWSSVVPSILILTSELACLAELCLSLPPAAAARSQARPGISLSSLSRSALYLVPGLYHIIYVELSFVTRLISGWMERKGERGESVLSGAVKTCIGTVETWPAWPGRQHRVILGHNKDRDNHFWQRSCLAPV